MSVHYLNGSTVRSVNESIVSLLTDLTEMAKGGELLTIAVACELTERRRLTDIAGGPESDVLVVIGGCELVKFELLKILNMVKKEETN